MLARLVALSAALAAVVLPVARAHMRLEVPIPRCATNNPNTRAECGEADYNMTAPVWDETARHTELCRGHKPGKPVTKWSAGSDVQVTIGGEADHGGGWCQLALSYNNKDFVVIENIPGECPTVRTHTATIPKKAKGRAVFLWSWFNHLGNREQYTNCADVYIENGDAKSDGCISGKKPLMANYPGSPLIISPEMILTDTDLLSQGEVIRICPGGLSEIKTDGTSASAPADQLAPSYAKRSDTEASSPVAPSNDGIFPVDPATKSLKPSGSTTEPAVSATRSALLPPRPTAQRAVDTDLSCTTCSFIELFQCRDNAFVRCVNGCEQTTPCPTGTVCAISHSYAECVWSSA